MSKADHPSGSPGNSPPDHQARTQTQRIPQVHPSSLFSILTGLLLLLTFCFLPWFASSISCNLVCDPTNASVELSPDAPPGLTVAGAGVAIAHLTFLAEPTLSEPTPVPTTIAPIPQDQFRLPLLWILPGMSFLLLLLPLVSLFKRRKFARVRAGVTLLAFCVSLFIELFYLVSTFSAFPLTKNALNHAASLSGGTITLSTFPVLGYWLALLLTLVGGTFTLWAALERRSQQRTLTRRLAHLEHTFATGGYRSYIYRTFPFRVTRPERGAINTVHTCPLCGKTLTLHTASEQRNWLYRSLIAIGLIASLLLIQQSVLEIVSGSGDSGGYTLLMVLCVPLAIYLLIFLFVVDRINLAQSPFARAHRIY
jgi:hypothetical protein